MEFINENINFELICQNIDIEVNKVANCYIFGSVKLGLHSNASDIDLIIVLYGNENENLDNVNIEFYNESIPYFHNFDLRSCNINNHKYDVNVYNQYQFQKLLSLHFMVIVECIFSKEPFILKQDINFLPYYYENCLTKENLYYSLNEEVNYCIGVMNKSKSSFHERLLWASKKIFNTARYFTSIIQLLIYQNIDTFLEFNYLSIEIRQLIRNGGNLYEALDIAIKNVRIYLNTTKSKEQNHLLDEDIECLNKLIDKWENSL